MYDELTWDEKRIFKMWNLSWSNHIDRYYGATEVVNGVQQSGFCYKCGYGIVFCTGDGDIVAQDGHPLQGEGRTPGDEDSGGVEGGHIEVTDWLQQTCMYIEIWQLTILMIATCRTNCVHEVYLVQIYVLYHFYQHPVRKTQT